MRKGDLASALSRSRTIRPPWAVTIAAPLPRTTAGEFSDPVTGIFCASLSTGPVLVGGGVNGKEVHVPSAAPSLTGTRRKSPTTVGGSAILPAVCPT